MAEDCTVVKFSRDPSLARIENLKQSDTVDKFGENVQHFGVFYVTCIALSIITYVLDLALACILLYVYYDHGYGVYFALTLTFMLLSALFMTAISLRWYIVDHDDPSLGKTSLFHWIVRIIFLLLQLSPLLRYIDTLIYGIKSKIAGATDNENQQTTLYRRMLDEDTNGALLRLFHCFLHSAPQAVIQLMILLKHMTHCDEIGNRKELSTGDYNMTPDRHLGAAWIDKCRPDILISESTYATTIRDSKRCRERDFLKKIHECIDRGGKVLIPVFALGRAQELCILLETYWERMNLKAPVYFALGLTEKANNYYKMFITWTNQKIRKTFVQRNMFDFKHIKPFDRQYIDNPGPMVVFATPGMLHAGLSLQIFKKWAPFENNMVIMPGFCVQGTVGHKILNGAKRVEFENRQVVEVKMSVEYMSFSAHADAKGIMQLIQYCEPKNVMLVHGEAEKMEFLKEKIQQEFNIKCYNPANGETAIIQTPVKIPIDVSLPLLKSEAKKFNALPPDPKRRRTLHGVLVMKDNSICMMDVDDACKEAGINRHIIRFTSTVHINDSGPTLSTSHKLHSVIKEKLPQWSVIFSEGEISVESVLVKVEGDDDDQKSVYVSWTNQDEDLGSYILNLLNCMSQ